MPDISKINNVAVADISKLDAVTFADGQKVNNQSVSLITDAHTLISSQDAGGATAVTFSSLGSYDVLLFDWINFDSTDGADDVLSFQVTTSSYSYNAYITSTYFRGYHTEAGASGGLAYYVSGDQENADQVYQWLGAYMDEGEDDSSSSGNLTIFGHSSGTYVKHFMSRSSTEAGAAAFDAYVGGFVNTPEAITAVQFKALGGGTFTGTIKLYGLATS
jgi:hypothetical protein